MDSIRFRLAFDYSALSPLSAARFVSLRAERNFSAAAPTETLAKTINSVSDCRRYRIYHWDALFRFVEHPEIPIDNSISEREFQHIAKLRLNSLFAGSTEGAHRAATLLGISATCRAIGVDPLAYLTWAFERQGTHREVYGLSAAQITPAAYKLALGERAGPSP